ncbi:MAG TPA: hypothetical protein VLB81_14720 [Gaiellales bacterium]|nr:hypothetical protein [Gaiellales bacterium]
MASTKRSSGGTRKSTASRSRAASASKPASGTRSTKARSNGRATTARSSNANRASTTKKTARASAGTSSQNGAKRTTTSRSGSSRSGTSARPRAAANRPTSTTDAIKQKGSALLQAADRANGPALTVAAAVAGLAGGLALRQRPRLSDPGIATRSKNVLRDVDPAAVLEGLGKATAELGKRSKLIARELDHVGERAERFGKILS